MTTTQPSTTTAPKKSPFTSPAILIGLAAVLGIVFGLVVGDWAANLEFIGDLFIRLIQMSIVPLVMTSVIVATASMSGKGMGGLAVRTFSWMFGFAVVSALVAVALATLLRPGAGMVFTGELEVDPADLGEPTGWQDTLLNFVSTNVLSAMAEGDMVPIIVFSLLFGLAMNQLIARTGNTVLLKVLDQAQQVILGMIKLVMYLAPIGVFCLLAVVAGDVGFAVITSALAYLGTNALGVIIILIMFVVVTTLVTRLNPLLLPQKLAEQTAIAVTTTSSAVTFPTALRNAVEKVGISQRVANFTLSIGMTMGSCGAVLNYTIVVLFLAQAGGVDLSAGQIVLGMALAILLNMGTITVPGGFPVVAMFLATSLGLPIQAIGLLIAVDWFTGVLRTFLNVNGDTFVAMLVANGTGEIDREVYNGTKSVTAEEIDMDAHDFEKADQE
ncbi:dicarboxylate/amino acid:cation symporter [Naumannella halotolerans]|uniref:Na+/H+-dicarboxylate symporter n=1 Tax=Naumannella halotolerans TaxID=993414 RepID=A0A4R7J7W2_9ACTN|nr:dicarboxylate/amino acid:cation symporter [Naumannella halotolerans]TDT33354.1 Na+/H+-dicarboxylate symporter [Naumannella halotolerans]